MLRSGSIVSGSVYFTPCKSPDLLNSHLLMFPKHKQMHAGPPSDSEVALSEKDEDRDKQANELES